jgi:aryl-alcohol dehydrogenase-like predicted oxidoreductase
MDPRSPELGYAAAMNTTRPLGAGAPAVFPIALGCMGMSGMYGRSDDNESIATIHEALERGVELVDTGDFYGMGHNEMLIGRALKDRRDRALLSVKFGALRGPDQSWGGFDGRPAAVKNFLAYSLKRLGVDHIDIYRPSRLDPNVPIEDTIGAVKDMVKAGYVRHIGLSEVGGETIRRASAVHPICDLQIEYAMVTRATAEKLFPVLDELGLSITAYGVLSRGLLAGSQPSQRDFRAHTPRFSAENRAQNQALVDTLARLAKAHGATPVQLAVAWVLHKHPRAIPVMGARTRAQLVDTLGAVTVKLSAQELIEIDAALPTVAGQRYAPEAMRSLDSER